MPIIIRTKIHEAWQDASEEERRMFVQDLCQRYRLHIEDILGINQEKEEA